MDYAKSFGSWFRHELGRRRLSQREFAAESGIPKSTINEWFHGRQPPDPANCRKIGAAWDIETTYLLKLAGHDDSYVDQFGDSRDDVVAALKRVQWNEERERIIRAVLDAMAKPEDAT